MQASISQQIEFLGQVLHESPYLSHDGKKKIEDEITEIVTQLKEGSLAPDQGEQELSLLDKKIAADEIRNLMTKLGHLNPSSPRLASLRALSTQLGAGEISPEQARHSIQHLMGE